MSERREDNSFHRPPRAYPDPVPEEQVTIAAPPQNLASTRETLLYAFFPIVGSMGIFAFAIVYDNKLFLYVACAMVAITAIFALGMRWAQRRSGKKTARKTRRRYREYLGTVHEKLREIANLQRSAAERIHSDPQRLWGVVLRREALWERRRSDRDFLEVRVGRGPVEHAAHPTVDLGHNPIAEYEQRLVDEATEMADMWRHLEDMPVPISLTMAPVVSVIGPRKRRNAAARSMICQAVAAHAPTDIRLAASFEADETSAWEWMKWLPHARSDDSSDGAPPAPGLANSPASLASLLEALVASRLEQLRTLAEIARTQRPELDVPHVLLVLDDFGPRDRRARLPLLQEVLNRGRELKISVIALVENADDEPSQTAARVRIPERGFASVEETGPGGQTVPKVALDEVAVGAAETLARGLAPIRLVDAGPSRSGRSGDGLLDLLGIESIDAVDPSTDWLPRPRELELRAMIGVNEAHEPLALDLKQAAEGGMGPHGLIIGATGSGKSELLRTLIASLALTHSPEQLAFVFIDYKGGTGLAELERLPHAAGMITNLQSDHTLIDRMHDALYGEQKRREQMLRDAGNVDDAVAYRNARRNNPELPPMPDLLVIIDEFSELLASRPDFIDLFVAIGRVGRGLGIHLLFTSQRFEEGRLRGLESHLRYRICLRTNSAPESKAVIGTADAYSLPSQPGLGYLKVDTAIYEGFRASLVSRPHVAAEQRKGPLISSFSLDGEQDSSRPVPAAAASGADSGPSEMQLMVDRLSRGRDKVHQVWLPPLRSLEPLDAIESRRTWWRSTRSDRRDRKAVLGTVDIPREQRSEPLTLDLAGGLGNIAVVGAPQSGKSTLLRTMILDLACVYRPDEVQFYGIDLGGGLLRQLAPLPHVGAIASKGDAELAQRLVRHAKEEIERREAEFRRMGIDSMADVRADEKGPSMPDVFLVIDGWVRLRNSFEDLDLEVEEVASAGLTYGVHVVVSAQRWSDMRPPVSDNLGGRLELRLNQPLDSDVGRDKAKRMREDEPGRGLTKQGYEFQTALPRLDGERTVDGLGDALARHAENIASHWDRPGAPAVQPLPLKITTSELEADLEAPGFPIGVGEQGTEPVYLDLDGADPHLLILGDSESGRSNLMRVVARKLAEEDPDRLQMLVVDPRRTLADLAELPHVTYTTNAEGVSQAAAQIGSTVDARLRSVADDGGAGSWNGPHVYLIVDDYDLLVGPEGSPLAPLASAVAHGRDVGLHVVLARRVAGATRASFEPFYQRLLEMRSTSLIFSGDPGEGPLLDNTKATHLPPGRAILIRRGERPTLVQTVLAAGNEAGVAQGT